MSTLTDFFTSLANKIRSKTGSTEVMSPMQMIDAIDDIYTPTQTKTVTAGTSATTVLPDNGFALSSVTVNPTPTQTKSASSSTSAQTVTPDSGKYLSSVSISAISPQRSSGTAASAVGRDNTGPYVYFPYGWWGNYSSERNYTRLTEAQGILVARKQEKTITSSRSAQTVTPDSNYLLSKVTVNALSPTGAYPANTRGSQVDMGATNNYRYVNTTNVPNSNSGTFTFTSSNSNLNGDTVDLTETNTIRYVNANNVYNHGYNNGNSTGYNSGYNTGYSSGYDAGFEKGKRFVLGNHANYIGVRGSNGGELWSTHDQYDILAGTKIRFYDMLGGDNKRIVVSTANAGTFGDIFDTGYTYSTDVSFTLTNGGNISITIMSRDGSEQRAWISFENPSY